jgi:hypothetical protein
LSLDVEKKGSDAIGCAIGDHAVREQRSASAVIAGVLSAYLSPDAPRPPAYCRSCENVSSEWVCWIDVDDCKHFRSSSHFGSKLVVVVYFKDESECNAQTDAHTQSDRDLGIRIDKHQHFGSKHADKFVRRRKESNSSSNLHALVSPDHAPVCGGICCTHYTRIWARWIDRRHTQPNVH